MKPLKVLSDLLPIPSYTVIILCFFFPFFLIKCGDTTLMSIKGTDLVTGVSKKTMNDRMKETMKKSSPFGSAFGKDEYEESYTNSDNEYSPLNDSKPKENKKDNENIPPNPLIIVTFLMAIAGIAVQLIKSVKKKYIYHIIFSAAGLASLLIFYWSFQAKMEGLGNNELGMGLGGGVSISYGFGTALYVCGVIFLLILSFFGVFSYYLKNSPESIYGSQRQNQES
ncbi:hypothetical protein [Chryseobacterium daeguense]|uniref:hypothetical protein n=1 Tax=Chryseobacterium daeguense TaxID=412438 RepID=UPI00047F808C|nr:hypothetical protein [Chryseobacterium daeguense]